VIAQSVHELLSGLSAGSWLVNVTVTARSPPPVSEIPVMVSAESVVAA
jgi:hypothetical protein